MHSSEMMYPPVKQSLLANLFTQGGGTSYIDETIVSDREALELYPGQANCLFGSPCN
jgi:hypothetical protein